MRTLIVVLLFGIPGSALAQDAVSPAPPVTLGLSASVIGDGHEFGLFGAGPTLLLSASPVSALQLTFDLHRNRYSSHVEIDSIYTVQYRHTFGRDLARPRMYVTLGGAGYMSYSHTDASSYFTPERAKTVSGDGVVTSTTPAHWTDVPARTSVDMSLPIAPIAGVGIEGHDTPRLGLEASVTTSAWPGVAWRFSAGFTVAIGRLR
jgi:hypothetical protein